MEPLIGIPGIAFPQKCVTMSKMVLLSFFFSLLQIPALVVSQSSNPVLKHDLKVFGTIIGLGPFAQACDENHLQKYHNIICWHPLNIDTLPLKNQPQLQGIFTLEN